MIVGCTQKVDLCFKVLGQSIPVDHGFSLYGGLAKILPLLHEGQEIGIKLIRGRYTGNGLLSLSRNSRLTIRLPSDKIPQLLDLAGKTLSVDGHSLTIGTPTVVQLKPRSVLYSHLVTTKNGNNADRFATAIQDKLSSLGIHGRVTIGRRKTFKIHDKQVVGYSMLISELTAEESILLQEQGLGGRRKIGCGIFEGIR